MIPAILSPSPRRRTAHDGFALVIALSLMAFVLLLLLSITTLVQVETQSAAIASAQVEAEQAALLGLQIALGELQKAAGPDQRVTATADIIDDSSNLYTGGTTVPIGQGSWTGVWKSDTVAVGTPSYNPATPNTRSFVGWLVSATDANGNLELPTVLADVAINVTSTGSTNGVPNYVSLFNRSDGTSYTQVEKVLVDSGQNGDAYFAFHVEDESVKADLSWSETPSNTISSERYQASRLSAAAGPDYGALNGVDDNGPFAAVTYPLTIDSSAILTDVLKAGNPVDLTISMTNSANASKWLKDNRAAMTWGSKGVLADVKWGGLRRDLSLAFEMDGIEEAENATNFNNQAGEFVGDSDRLSAPMKPNGLPKNERFLWRDYIGSGTSFSSDILANSPLPAVLRGPNWWALRDYANLYKRLSGTPGDYAMQARPYFPNRSTEGEPYSAMFDIIGRGDGWDMETRYQQQGPNSGDLQYIYRPARPNYSPVYLGASVLVSALAANVVTDVAGVPVTADLAIGVDPLFYFWNPYNRKITVDQIAIGLGAAFPSGVSIWINPSGGAETEDIQVGLKDLFKYNVTNKTTDWNPTFTYLVKDPSGNPITLEPGEVVIVSATDVAGVAQLGYSTNNSSGIIIDEVDVILNSAGRVTGTKPVPLDLVNGTRVGVCFIDSGSGDRHDVDIALPDPAVVNSAADLYTNLANFGEETQSWHMPMWAGGRGLDEYTSPEANGSEPVAIFDAIDLVSGKQYFGLHSLLIKPASFSGTNPNPIEVFARYNPITMLMNRDYYRDCMLNQVYNHITANGASALLQNAGIGLSGSSRGANFGLSYDFLGSNFVPVSNIPSSPLFSLAEFSNANLSMMGTDPLHAVGNSWSSPVIPPVSPYGQVQGQIWSITGQDFSWLINDALFDRYYLSGLAPDFSIGSTGYTSGGKTIEDTLNKFFDTDTDPATNYRDALANPVLRPYLPDGKTEVDAIADLSANDGYTKMGAYSLIDGAFNVNSTSVDAWKAFLSSNRDLSVDYADGGSNTATGIPFPKSVAPSAPGSGLNGPQPEWAGFQRLTTDAQISALASEIVSQVKLRGPFMSISDFVNRRVGNSNASAIYTGALQAAINEVEEAGQINSSAKAASLDFTPEYPTNFYPDAGPINARKTTTGIATSISQADLLLALAPRLTARSDTFRIRAYGETRSRVGSEVTSRAVCEAVVQRLPEYVDSTDEAWDDPFTGMTDDPIATQATLTALNQRFGRQFKIVQFRWLSSDEI
jgi:hypothetical protein